MTATSSPAVDIDDGNIVEYSMEKPPLYKHAGSAENRSAIRESMTQTAVRLVRL